MPGSVVSSLFEAIVPEPVIPIVAEPADFRFQARDRDAILTGKAVFIRGRALAKADFLCREAGHLELFWYWVANGEMPYVIDDLVLPDRQYVTTGHCTLDGGEVIKVNRKVRRQGNQIAGAGHSHGDSSVFSSPTDIEMIQQLHSTVIILPCTIRRPTNRMVQERKTEREKIPLCLVVCRSYDLHDVRLHAS